MVSLSATGGVSVFSGGGKDTIEVATVDGARYYNYINISGGNNYINNSNILHSTIKAGTGSDTITSGGYFSSILASGGHNRIILTTENGNNTITAFSGNDYVSIKGASGNNYINVGKGKNTVRGGTGNSSTVIAGDGNNYVSIGGGLVSLGNASTGSKVSLGSYGSASIISGSGNDTLLVAKADGARYYNVIDMGEGNNYINNSNILHSTISAGAGNDTIVTGGYYASINAGAGNNLVSLSTENGNNTIITGAGNDSILGNASDNLFVYAGGNDLLGESATGSKISLAGDGASNLTDISGIAFDSLGSGVLTFNDDSNNTLTIQNAAGLKVVINGTTRLLGENALYSENQQSVTLTSAYTGDIDASKFTNFNAAALGRPVALLGNVLANNLVGGKGNDTLYGVAGNDTLNGGAGSDTFLYTANTGNDTIGDYESVDVLQILKADGAAGGTFTDSAYSSGKLTLTIDGGGSVVFADVSTSTTFNVNGDSYTISDNALVKK